MTTRPFDDWRIPSTVSMSACSIRQLLHLFCLVYACAAALPFQRNADFNLQCSYLFMNASSHAIFITLIFSLTYPGNVKNRPNATLFSLESITATGIYTANRPMQTWQWLFCVRQQHDSLCIELCFVFACIASFRSLPSIIGLFTCLSPSKNESAAILNYENHITYSPTFLLFNS